MRRLALIVLLAVTGAAAQGAARLAPAWIFVRPQPPPAQAGWRAQPDRGPRQSMSAALPPPIAATEFPVKRAAWAAVAGAIAGAVIGTRAVSFANVPSDRGAHELRSGLVYGAIGGVLAPGLTVRFSAAAHTPEPHRFLLDRWNTPLLAGMAAVHGLDFASTRYFRNRGKDEWLLTDGVVDNRAAFVATEISALGAGVSLMYLLHRSGHHRIERWAAAGYIALGVVSAIANFRYPSTGHGLY